MKNLAFMVLMAILAILLLTETVVLRDLSGNLGGIIFVRKHREWVWE